MRNYERDEYDAPRTFKKLDECGTRRPHGYKGVTVAGDPYRIRSVEVVTETVTDPGAIPGKSTKVQSPTPPRGIGKTTSPGLFVRVSVG